MLTLQKDTLYHITDQFKFIFCYLPPPSGSPGYFSGNVCGNKIKAGSDKAQGIGFNNKERMIEYIIDLLHEVRV